jgi:hypothetical protein
LVVDAERKKEFQLQLDDGKDQLQRLKLVKGIPHDLAPGFKEGLEASAFNLLTSLLNLVGENIAYYATFKRASISKTGTFEPWFMA